MLIQATCVSFFAFVLPVSTPPKAIGFGTHRIQSEGSLEAGLVKNIVAVVSSSMEWESQCSRSTIHSPFRSRVWSRSLKFTLRDGVVYIAASLHILFNPAVILEETFRDRCRSTQVSSCSQDLTSILDTFGLGTLSMVISLALQGNRTSCAFWSSGLFTCISPGVPSAGFTRHKNPS